MSLYTDVKAAFSEARITRESIMIEWRRGGATEREEAHVVYKDGKARVCLTAADLAAAAKIGPVDRIRITTRI